MEVCLFSARGGKRCVFFPGNINTINVKTPRQFLYPVFIPLFEYIRIGYEQLRRPNVIFYVQVCFCRAIYVGVRESLAVVGVKNTREKGCAVGGYV